MPGEVTDADAAADVASEYAREDCAGTLGDVTDVRRNENEWVVEFRTHTLSEAREHQVRITRVGNVFAHERIDGSE